MTHHRLLSNIDWFLYEDVHTAHVYSNDDLVPITSAQLSQVLFHTGRPVLIAPVGRYEQHNVALTLNTPCSVRDVMTTLYDFYQTPADDALVGLVGDSGYKDDALQRMANGEIVKTFELNGSDACLFTGPGRRHALLCSGAVRFEGLDSMAPGVYTVLLGT